MAWNDTARRMGKEALALLAKTDEPLDSVGIKYALYELNQQYREPPLNGGLYRAEIRCTEEGWVALTDSGYSGRVQELGRQYGTAEEALEAIVADLDGQRAQAQKEIAEAETEAAA